MMHLIAIIGDREIKLNGKYFHELFSKDSIKEESKKIYENIEKHKKEIDIQILPFPIKKIGKENISRITLFATNQSNDHQGQDTIWIAKIIKELIEDLTIEIKECKINPINAEECFEYASKELNELSKNDEKMVFINSGGTPQLKLSFLVLLSEKFNPLIYQVSEKTNEVYEFNHIKTIKKESLKSSLKKLAKNHDYYYALKLLEENELGTNELKNFLEYSNQRLLFNFKKSNELIKSLGKEFDEFIIIESKEFHLNELHINMEIKLDKGEYADFLARLYCFFENLIFYACESKKNIELIGLKDDEQMSAFSKALTKKEKDYIINADSRACLSKPSYITIIPLLKFHGYKVKNLNCIRDWIGKSRNKTIISHGFSPASKDSFTDKSVLGIKNLILNTLKDMNFEITENPFLKINKKLNELMDSI